MVNTSQIVGYGMAVKSDLDCLLEPDFINIYIIIAPCKCVCNTYYFHVIGEVLGSEALIYSVFEFIHVLVDMKKFHSVIKENIKQLLYYVTIYTQMTSEQVSHAVM